MQSVRKNVSLIESYSYFKLHLHRASDRSAIFLTVLPGRTVKKSPSPIGPGFESRHQQQKGHRSLHQHQTLEYLRESELPPEPVPPLSVIALPTAAATAAEAARLLLEAAAALLCPRLELLGSIVTFLEILDGAATGEAVQGAYFEDQDISQNYFILQACLIIICP